MDHVKKKAVIMELLFLALILFLGWRLRVRSLSYVMHIGEVLILTAVLKSVPLLEMSLTDLLAMACALLFDHVVMQLFFWEDSSFASILPFLLMLLLELLVLVRGIHGRKRGYGAAVGYAVLCCLASLCVYRRWKELFLYYFTAREGEFGYTVKALCLLAGLLVISAVILAMIQVFHVFLKGKLRKLHEYSMTYTEIDRSVLLVIILTLITLSMRGLVSILILFLPAETEIHLFSFWLYYDAYEIPLLWTGFFVMMILIQIIYIRLLAKSISVKEEMRLQEKNLHQLAEYNHELEKNIEDMRGIRHDMNNMFLTMGGFVDRSGDEEMKIFYEENIVPFARQELQKNELYGKLSCIHGESLKSFLYFKIMQGIEQDVSINLLVQPMDAEDIFGIGQIDLIRILGILIDNAIEEAKLCKGTVTVSVREKEQEYLFSVSNTVRQQKKERGIVAGTTEKGLGRGNGLLILDRLVLKYRNVLLNSFFKEEEFVQCLRIGK